MSISYHQWWFLRSASVWAPLTWPGLCPPVAVIAVYHWPVAQTFADPDSVLSSPSFSSPLSLNLLTAVVGCFFNNCKFQKVNAYIYIYIYLFLTSEEKSIYTCSFCFHCVIKFLKKHKNLKHILFPQTKKFNSVWFIFHWLYYPVLLLFQIFTCKLWNKTGD